MAATALTPVKSTRVTGGAGAPRAGALVAIDATNGNSFVNTGREILVVTTDANARTIEFLDKNGVKIGTSSSLEASKTYIFGPFKVYDWGNPMVFKANNAAVTAAVYTLDDPSTYGTNH